MVQQTAKRWRPSVLTKTRGGRTLGRAKLARLFFLLVLAAALGLQGGVSGADEATVSFPSDGNITVSWPRLDANEDDPDYQYQVQFYAGPCNNPPVRKTHSTRSSSVSTTTADWGIPGAGHCVLVGERQYTRSSYRLHASAEFTMPGTTPSHTYGSPSAITFTSASGGYGTATMFLPVTSVSIGDEVSFAWTVSPATAVEHSTYTTQQAVDEAGTIGVRFDVMGLLAHTTYTVTVRDQGAADSSIVSLTYRPRPEYIPFHGPTILKAKDQTPYDPDTATLEVTSSTAPANPATGYWIRYNTGDPLVAESGQELNVVRELPPIHRSVETVDIEVLAYYDERATVTYRGEDLQVPADKTWFTSWSETYSFNIARASSTGSEVPPKPVAPLVVETAEKILEASGLPADQAHSYSLLFLLFLTLGVGGFLYAATGGGPMSATLAGFVGVIIWSGLGWWWFGLPVAMALVPLMLIIIVGGMAVTTRVLS